MIRFLTDEDFKDQIFHGVLRRLLTLDMVRVQDVGLAGVGDPDILAWAAANDRIILTHDRATLPDYAYERLAVGENMPGVFILNDRFPVGDATREILLITAVSEQPEWSDRVVYLPL